MCCGVSYVLSLQLLNYSIFMTQNTNSNNLPFTVLNFLNKAFIKTSGLLQSKITVEEHSVPVIALV